MKPARAWFTLQDPRLEPREEDPCDECGYRRGSNEECAECRRVAAIREDAATDPESNRARVIGRCNVTPVIRRPTR